jgi:hypothetical protein
MVSNVVAPNKYPNSVAKNDGALPPIVIFSYHVIHIQIFP